MKTTQEPAPDADRAGFSETFSLREAKNRLAWTVLLSRLWIFWEAAWPRLVPPLIVLAFYAGLAWLGFWIALPVILRVVLLLGLAAVFAWTLRPLFALSWPDRAQGLHRVELVSGHSHRPLAAMEDDLSVGQGDPQTRALWAAHQRRMAEALRALKAGFPSPQAFRVDPYGLRALAALLLVTGFVYAGGERWQRLVTLFPNEAEAAAVTARIDAWVTPPVYTGKPPIFLTGTATALRDPSAPISVPTGSELLIRSQGSDRISVIYRRAQGSDEILPAEQGVPASAPVDRKALLEANGRLDIRDGEETVASWVFDVKPDQLPTIRLLDDPEEQFSGSLKFSYLVQDDYGVAAAEAEIQPVREEGRSTGQEPRPLVEAPRFPLSLPSGEQKSGAAETFQDLTSHPWAGSEVELMLLARDQAGQEGRSEPHRFTLPQRNFAKPMARAIVEQRRELALDAGNQLRVINAIDALLIAPERFFDEPKHYLGTRFAYNRLVAAESDEELAALLPLLWDLALTIEDGDLSVAERNLRDAQEALRKALESGASDEEIARLTDELRKALNEYFQALAEQLRQNPQALQQLPDPNAQSLRPQDLDEMLRRIEELAKSGARDAARELLSQMQRMLENLQTGRMQNMPQGMSQEMMEALNELGQMIQRQQELMDQTNRFGQRDGQRRPGQQGQQGQQGEQGQQMTPEELAEALRQLQEQQGALAEQLQRLMEEMARNGMPQNQDLGRAGESMENAGKELGRGETGSAVGEQGNALEALRQGAQGMIDQMLGQDGQGPGQNFARGRSPLDEDPLGRPRRTEGPDFGDQVRVPDEIDVQRARRILEELRRRFSDPSRPALELDYLERLLRRY
ncbi:TIGR02302 family protein [Stappia sp. F7233]|uniref:TIGR02302 family protein n=1 Tax=Stappia albiluteola TaxID=2758565 RepID=A0A839AIK7_9HYPH|nr:TIGR02302 family protein [Stappia albiluteola]MBA5778587.1 TIGR02302 family protein [Stappia albiluteola]